MTSLGFHPTPPARSHIRFGKAISTEIMEGWPRGAASIQSRLRSPTHRAMPIKTASCAWRWPSTLETFCLYTPRRHRRCNHWFRTCISFAMTSGSGSKAEHSVTGYARSQSRMLASPSKYSTAEYSGSSCGNPAHRLWERNIKTTAASRPTRSRSTVTSGCLIVSKSPPSQ